MRQLLDHEKREIVKALHHYAKHSDKGTDLTLLALEIELAKALEVLSR
jgi:hypothetical protein